MQVMDYQFIESQYVKREWNQKVSSRYIRGFGWGTKLERFGFDKCSDIYTIMYRRGK